MSSLAVTQPGPDAGKTSATPLANYGNAGHPGAGPWAARRAFVTLTGPTGGASAPGDSAVLLRLRAQVGGVATSASITFPAAASHTHAVRGRSAPVESVIPDPSVVKGFSGHMGVAPAIGLEPFGRLLSVVAEDGSYEPYAARLLFAAFAVEVHGIPFPAPAPPATTTLAQVPASVDLLTSGAAYLLDRRRCPALPIGTWSALVAASSANFGLAGPLPLGVDFDACPSPILGAGVPPLGALVAPTAADFADAALVVLSHSEDPAAALSRCTSFAASLLHVADFRHHCEGTLLRAPSRSTCAMLLRYVLHSPLVAGDLPQVYGLINHYLALRGLAPVPPAPAAIPGVRPPPAAGLLPPAALSLLPTSHFWAEVSRGSALIGALADPFAAVGGPVPWLGAAVGAGWAAPAGGWDAAPADGALLAGLPTLPVLGQVIETSLPYTSGIAQFCASFTAGGRLPPRGRPAVPLDLMPSLAQRFFLQAAVVRAAADLAVARYHVCQAVEDAAFGEFPSYPVAAQAALLELAASSPLQAVEGEDFFATMAAILGEASPITAAMVADGVLSCAPPPLLRPLPGLAPSPMDAFLLSLAFGPETQTLLIGAPSSGSLSIAVPASSTSGIWGACRSRGLPPTVPACVVDGAAFLSGYHADWACELNVALEEGMPTARPTVALPTLRARLPDGASLASWGVASLLFAVYVPYANTYVRLQALPWAVDPGVAFTAFCRTSSPGPLLGALDRRAARLPVLPAAPATRFTSFENAAPLASAAVVAPSSLAQVVATCTATSEPMYWALQAGPGSRAAAVAVEGLLDAPAPSTAALIDGSNSEEHAPIASLSAAAASGFPSGWSARTAPTSSAGSGMLLARGRGGL